MTSFLKAQQDSDEIGTVRQKRSLAMEIQLFVATRKEMSMKKIKSIELVGELLKRYESQHERVQAYFGLLAYYALTQAALCSGNEVYLKKSKEYLKQYPDHFDHPQYSFEAYRAGGNAKAWLFFKGKAPEWSACIDEYAQKTMEAPADENGILCLHSDSSRKRIWIDVVTCITPFMLYAGLALHKERYIDFAAEQCFKMYEVFLDHTCGLLHQARGFLPNPKRITSDHWSRGNGWGLLGLAELVRYLPEDSKHRAKAEEYFVDMVDALLPYQTERGLWRQEITEPMAWEESSGTGLILYCIGIGLRTGILKSDMYRTAFERGIAGLAEYCLDDNFATYRGCPGCMCPRIGDEIGTVRAYITGKIPQKDEVHSYGCMMLAFVEAYRNGIVDVEIKGNI